MQHETYKQLFKNVIIIMDKIDYENEPFVYCKRCLSLDIRVMDGLDFCNNCGSFNHITECNDMDEWLDMYNKAYKDDPNKEEGYLYKNRKHYKH